MMTQNWVKTGLGNGLLPDVTKSLLKSMQVFIGGVMWHSPGGNFKWFTQESNPWSEFENYCLKLFPHLPGANELTGIFSVTLQNNFSAKQGFDDHYPTYNSKQMVDDIPCYPSLCFFFFLQEWGKQLPKQSSILVHHAILPFYVLNFSEGTKHISTFYVIPPHLHDTGRWNPPSYKTRTCLFYIVNSMGADALATQRARASATMILKMLNRINSVPAR